MKANASQYLLIKPYSRAKEADKKHVAEEDWQMPIESSQYLITLFHVVIKWFLACFAACKQELPDRGRL